MEEIYKANISARLDEIKVEDNNDGKGINIQEEVIPKKDVVNNNYLVIISL